MNNVREPTLKMGSRGDDVREMQKLLNVYHAATKAAFLKIDGIFGLITRDALIKYQKANMITPNGICGPDTWEELRKLERPTK